MCVTPHQQGRRVSISTTVAALSKVFSGFAHPVVEMAFGIPSAPAKCRSVLPPFTQLSGHRVFCLVLMSWSEHFIW